MVSINHPNDLVFPEYMVQGVAKDIYNVSLDEVHDLECLVKVDTNLMLAQCHYRIYGTRSNQFLPVLKVMFLRQIGTKSWMLI
jgi:hypothetical protein